MVKHESEQALDALNAIDKLTETLVSAEQAVGGAVRTVEASADAPPEVAEAVEILLDGIDQAVAVLNDAYKAPEQMRSLALQFLSDARAEAHAARPAPERHPAEQALLDACDAVPLNKDASHDGSPYLLPSTSLALARAIDHWRAAKAEGFVK